MVTNQASFFADHICCFSKEKHAIVILKAENCCTFLWKLLARCESSASPFSKISMSFFVAPWTKSYQIFGLVIAQLASSLNVVDL